MWKSYCHSAEVRILLPFQFFREIDLQDISLGKGQIHGNFCQKSQREEQIKLRTHSAVQCGKYFSSNQLFSRLFAFTKFLLKKREIESKFS